MAVYTKQFLFCCLWKISFTACILLFKITTYQFLLYRRLQGRTLGHKVPDISYQFAILMIFRGYHLNDHQRLLIQSMKVSLFWSIEFSKYWRSPTSILDATVPLYTTSNIADEWKTRRLYAVVSSLLGQLFHYFPAVVSVQVTFWSMNWLFIGKVWTFWPRLVGELFGIFLKI